jgi:RNA-directed DNA polymerase
MSRMWAERLEDRALLRLSKKGLNAGVLDTDGQGLHPATGTPQGGSIAPILANVYVHDALDRWCEKGVKRRCRGEACLIRYADDVVWAVEHQAEADRCYEALGQGRGEFGLELSAEKTRVILFRRQRPAEKTSCELLGCECRWGKDRAGTDHLDRRPSRKKVRNSRKRFTQ